MGAFYEKNDAGIIYTSKPQFFQIKPTNITIVVIKKNAVFGAICILA